jgi:hypothetical protein
VGPLRILAILDAVEELGCESEAIVGGELERVLE